MGATTSKGASDSWSVSVPRYQIVRLGTNDKEILNVPRIAVEACKLSPGDCVYLRDCLGRTYTCVLQTNGMQCWLGSSWNKVVTTFGCISGDEVMFKWKAAKTWKIRVFCGTSGVQKFPVVAECQANEKCVACKNVNIDNNETWFSLLVHPIHTQTSESVAADAGQLVSPPCDAQEGHEVFPPVFAENGVAIDSTKKDYCDMLSATFDMQVPLYYGKIKPNNVSSGFYTLASEYGKKFVMPLLDVKGYPKEVVVTSPREDEHFRAKFRAYRHDGAMTIYDGLELFLQSQTIEADTEFVLRFDFTVDPIKLFFYEF